jgi:cytochrome b561
MIGAGGCRLRCLAFINCSVPCSFPSFSYGSAHAGLYVLLIVQPLVGWIAVSASGAQAAVLGLFTLPSVAPEDPILAEKLFVLHDLFGISIAGLVAAHIGAALYHHVVRRDRIMMRMITG